MNLIDRIIHHRAETRPPPEAWKNNTEDCSEPFNGIPDTDDEVLSATDPSTAAVMVQCFFVHGQPDPGGFPLKASSIREVFVAGVFNGWNPADLPLEQRADGYREADVALALGCGYQAPAYFSQSQGARVPRANKRGIVIDDQGGAGRIRREGTVVSGCPLVEAEIVYRA
jgi:hypothetical protein